MAYLGDTADARMSMFVIFVGTSVTRRHEEQQPQSGRGGRRGGAGERGGGDKGACVETST